MLAVQYQEAQKSRISNHGVERGKRRIWQTLFEVNNKYIPIKQLGRGAYGVVFLSSNKKTNEKVAIKKISNVFDHQINALRTLREMLLLRHIRHDNVIALKDVILMPSAAADCPPHHHPGGLSGFNDVYLVYELMDTDLNQIIRSPQPLSADHAKYFLFQLLRGLKYLHSSNVLHRDLKPGNLLINANCDLKICDFGLARTGKDEEEPMTEYVVTRWYRAPELLLGCDKYGASVDMWSVGCIFAEILGRRPIFPGKESLHQINLIMFVLGRQDEADFEFIDNLRNRNYIKSLNYLSRGIRLSRLYPQADPLAIDLLEKMLVFDPRKRISVAEALQHPYLAGLYEPSLNLSAEFRIDMDVEGNMGEPMIRELMWKEMLHYHPEVAFLMQQAS